MMIKVLFIMINNYLIHLKEFIKMIDKFQLIVINYLMSNHKIEELMKFNHKMINFLNRMINRVNIKKNQIKQLMIQNHKIINSVNRMMCWINIKNPYIKVMINKKIKLIKNHQINNLMINNNNCLSLLDKPSFFHQPLQYHRNHQSPSHVFRCQEGCHRLQHGCCCCSSG